MGTRGGKRKGKELVINGNQEQKLLFKREWLTGVLLQWYAKTLKRGLTVPPRMMGRAC